MEKGLSVSGSKLLSWHLRSHSAKKNVGVFGASYWVIGHMSILVLPDSSDVAAVAV